MPITPRQKEARRAALGGSDMAAILGVDPWRNAWDVWAEKTGRIEQEEKENPAMHAGTMFENGVLDWAESQIGKLRRNTDEDPLEYPWDGFPIVDHPDAIVLKDHNPVEAKTVALFGPASEDWGEHGDEVPDRVIVQCHVHMGATGTQMCHVPTFIGGRGFVMYGIEYDNEIGDNIMDSSLDFWSYVESGEPPANIVPSVKFIKRLRRVPEKMVDLDPALTEAYKTAQENFETFFQIKEDAYAAVVSALGDAEAGQLPDGSMMTFFEQKREAVDVKRLKSELPEIAAKYLKESKYRALRFKKAPKQKY